MPASGNKDQMSQEELHQRAQASRKHGAYSTKMTPERAHQLAELEDALATRPGVVAIQNEQTAKAVAVLNVAMSYAIQQHKDGKPLERIPIFKMLPAFMNSAQRALKQLHEMLPDDRDILDASNVLEAVKDGHKD